MDAGTIYYLRAYATNSVGTSYGSEVNFQTDFFWTGTIGTDWGTSGNWENGNAPTASSDNVVIPNVANDPIINEAPATPATCNKLTLNSGASLTINAGKALTVNGNLYNSGTITIKSSNTGTGSLITNDTLTGSINDERYIAAWGDADHGWHELSSPVINMVIAGSDFVPGTNDDLYKWDEVQNLWLNYKVGANNITNFTNGEGYLVAYQTTATKIFTGTPNNANVSKSGLTYTDASAYAGWHLLGNPYPCALQWNHTTGVSGWNLSNIDGTAKIWNESSASYTDIFQNGIIPAMQGFMVHVTASGTGSLTIPTTDRTHSSTAWYKEEEINKIKLTAYDPERSTAQESIIRFNENATTGFDSEHDSRFLSGYAPLFYSATSYGNLSTNTLPEITAELTIPMNFIKNSYSTFYIEAEGVNNLIPQETVYLTDLKTNHTQNLNENPVYSFTSAEGDDPARFLIHFSPMGIENPAIADRINIFSYMNNLYV